MTTRPDRPLISASLQQAKMEALERRMDEILDQWARVMGLSEEEIVKTSAEAEAEVKEQIERG